jgi:hypothetical protein
MMLELIGAGLAPMPLRKSDCARRLEVIHDIPAPGKCICGFERTALVRARAVRGDVVEQPITWMRWCSIWWDKLGTASAPQRTRSVSRNAGGRGFAELTTSEQHLVISAT